jgi:transcriptional regulator with XRE-family HTH domain
MKTYVGVSYISEIETGKKNASHLTIELLCKGLGVTTLEFHKELCVTIEKGW